MEDCKICNREFDSLAGLSRHVVKTHNINVKEYYDKFIKKEDEGVCYCGKNTTFSSMKIGYLKYCSYICLHNSFEVKEKKKQTCLKNNGTEYPGQSKEVQEKSKQTFKQKYNVEYPLQVKEFLEKSLNTCKDHYGVEHPYQNENIKLKGIQNCLQNNGVKHPYQLKEVREKGKITCQKNWGVENPSQSKEINNKKINTHQKHCGFDHWAQSPQGRKSNRIKAIKETETRMLNGEPLMPNIGNVERVCLNELQLLIKPLIIKRQFPDFRYKIGRIPDGFIKELNLIILYHERQEHYSDQECIIEKEDTTRTTKDYESLGLKVFIISEYQWLNNKEEVIENFKCVIKGLEDVQNLQVP